MCAVYVPPVTRRRRIPQKAIDDIVRQIVEKFNPQKIILFGSYARGDFKPESDLDLLVVMETSLRENRQALLIEQSLDVDLFGLDLLVKTPQGLSERIAQGDRFLQNIVETGRVLYECPDA